jgi:glycine C-acetyltransferase
MDDLEAQLKSARATGAHALAIVTDGAFSMDGSIANLPAICGLAQRYEALVIVDDSHAVGVVGPQGRGTPSLLGVAKAVNVMTGTFGKALGGALGGYVAGPRGLIDVLRRRARPYLFSNSLPPPVVAAAIAAIDLAEAADQDRERLAANASQLRAGLDALGLSLLGANHPIVPVLLGDADAAAAVEARLRAQGILARAFTYPVVPRGQARVRCQVSAAHTTTDIQQVLTAFEAACRPLQHA